MKLTITGRGATLYSQFQQHFVAFTKRVVEEASIDAEMVFAGYGVQAPEFQWDDFKGMDVKGKVLVVLINDPPVEDEKIFGGKAMTYYGDRKSTRLNSSHLVISYAVFCLKKKKKETSS